MTLAKLWRCLKRGWRNSSELDKKNNVLYRKYKSTKLTPRRPCESDWKNGCIFGFVDIFYTRLEYKNMTIYQVSAFPIIFRPFYGRFSKVIFVVDKQKFAVEIFNTSLHITWKILEVISLGPAHSEGRKKFSPLSMLLFTFNLFSV